MSPTSTPLSLSTCWATKQTDSVPKILDLLEKTGFSSFELDYRILQKQWSGILAGFKALGFSVSSLHNFVPHPAEMPPEMASGDLFNLASREKDERTRAVDLTVRTLERASELEAPAVVLHLGWVEGALDKQVVKDAADKGGPTPELGENLAKRDQLSPGCLDAASFSLERLLKRAEPLGVKLGLENRIHPGQMPSLPECRLLLERFFGAPLGHWHDIGHSRVQQRAGLDGPEQWLSAFGDQLLGCHLHDSAGGKDHQLPGRADEDWEAVAGLLAKAPIKVLEIHPGPNAAEISAACDMLLREFAGANRE